MDSEVAGSRLRGEFCPKLIAYLPVKKLYKKLKKESTKSDKLTVSYVNSRTV